MSIIIGITRVITRTITQKGGGSSAAEHAAWKANMERNDSLEFLGCLVLVAVAAVTIGLGVWFAYYPSVVPYLIMLPCCLVLLGAYGAVFSPPTDDCYSRPAWDEMTWWEQVTFVPGSVMMVIYSMILAIEVCGISYALSLFIPWIWPIVWPYLSQIR